MFKLKNLLLFSFTLIASSFYAQEICDNGIDDNNDGLIDINDDECQCLASVPYELTFGDICRSNLRLIVDDTDVLRIQWYRNGIAIEGEVFDRIDLKEETPNVEGIYLAMLSYSDGCYFTEPYEVIINTYEVDLGTETICEGESIQFGNFSIDKQGFFQNDAPAVDGCDSITSLNVIVEQPEFYFQDVSICNGETYDWDGMILTEEGTFESSYPSVGCDSIVFLTLTYLENVEVDISETICRGEEYILYDLSATTTGQYQTLFSNPNGCDTLFNIDLTVLEFSETYMQETICDGEDFVFLDIDENTSGLYNTTLTNSVGCDSIITVELAVLPNEVHEMQASICEGQVFILHDISETTAGVYETTIPAFNGCDSLIRVDLSIGQEVNVFLDENICEGDSFSIYDIMADQTGIYETRVLSGGACDTLVTLSLTVNQETTYTSQETICEGENFILDGINASTTGIYEDILTNANGCDSIITIDLTVIPQSNSTINEVFCEGDVFILNDITTDEPGTYETTFMNQNGCDSIVTVVLEVEAIPREMIFQTICEGENFVFRDMTLTEEGVYESIVNNTNSCDSIITLELTVNQPADGISLGEDIEVDLGQTINIIPEFTGQGLTEIMWLDESGTIIGEDIELLDVKPIEDTFFEVFALDANGCDAHDIINIDVDINIDIYIPNVFSPELQNSDSKFSVSFNEAVEGIQSVQIYDRWGSLVYDLNSSENFGYAGWDGRYNGQNLENGVYTYIMVFDIIDGSEVKKSGSITLL